MATWDDVARICLALPETTEGPCAEPAPVAGAGQARRGGKRALVAEEPDVYFTTSHFAGYPAVLCRLEALDDESLPELAAEAWACRAPKRLLAEHPIRSV